MRATFLVRLGDRKQMVRSRATNHTGRVIGEPSARKVVRMPVCDCSRTSQASSGLRRILIDVPSSSKRTRFTLATRS